MIRERILWMGWWTAWLGWSGSAWAQDTAGDEASTTEPASDETDAEEDDPLSRFRTPFPVLAERTIGSTSRPVEYNWRRSRLQLGGLVAQPFELNSFNSLRTGGLVRIPTNGRIIEVGSGFVFNWDTPSTEMLALTPYRQPGRPSRWSLEGNLGLPLAEGIVTASPRWFPAMELVLMGYLGLRYDWYPGSMAGMDFRSRLTATFNPGLTDDEVETLEDRRHPGMQLDRARYTPMIGLGNDIYLVQGVFISPRVMISVPLLAVASQSELLWWGDVSLVVGVAF